MRKPIKLALVTILLIINYLPAFAQQKVDTLRYPIQDRRGDRYSNKVHNGFDLKDTSYLKQTIEYDPKTKQYYLVEKIGNSYYRKPTSLTFDEFWRIREKQLEDENFRKRANTFFELNRGLVKPKLKVTKNLFNRIFGGITDSTGKIKLDIKPQGNLDVLAGYQGQNTKNPTLPENARKYGTFDFNMNTQFNLNASIGDKLKLPINYNTLANFDFENQLKLDYSGKDDEIIKKVEAGNMSFATKSTLIPGVQGLFGLKTQLQFGKLFITTALANEKSQKQTQSLSGGSANTTFNKKLDDYEENRHFLLGQYFHDNYNKAMSSLPVIQSQITILRMEVWVTNRTGITTNARTIVGLADLGENKPYSPNVPSLISSTLPQNGANQLYQFVTSSQDYRNPSLVANLLQGRKLSAVQDYEKTYARKLTSNEYTFRPDVGFISLNTTLQANDVLAVAYQYTFNGRTFQVGEFAQDVSLDTSAGIQKVMFLKLLKATSQRPNLPIWKLMMKNVYALNTSNLQRDGFTLNLLYQAPSGGLIRNLPEGDNPARPLLRILKLDRLNNNNDPQPDGIFDFIEGYTIQSQQGRIIFPVLEPFGKDLEALAFATPAGQAVKNKYLFNALYDTIKIIAQQNYAQFDRFSMVGTAKGSSSNEIYLNAFNVPQGSVTVTAGGQNLVENIDFIVDYNLGKVQILNQAILSSGQTVNVNYENNGTFGTQNKGFLGVRLDYALNKKLQLGATLERLTERPFYTKVNYGDDPVKNSMMGLDFNYHTESMGLTRLLNKLPFYNSKTISSIASYGEVAMLQPGHPPQIGSGAAGLIYVDDFEGSQSDIDLRTPFVNWTLASTPDSAGFPEANLSNNIKYGYNRSKLSWYQIETTLQDPLSPSNPNKDRTLLSDPRVRAVYNSELFPEKTVIAGQDQILTFDFNYNPKQRGPYNYDDNVSSINADGTLKNPTQRWGGIMRSIDQTDFETQNIETIDFWMQSPYVKNYTNTAGGFLYFNIGDISEDVLKDGRHFYENGLPTPSQPNLAVDTTTVWGKAPLNPVQLTQAFSTDPNDRASQDVGFDGLDDIGERKKRDSTLTNLKNRFGANSLAYTTLLNDPSSDNYKNYRDGSYDASKATILQRYKDYNNPQGNSPINTGGDLVTAATLYPDNEDLDKDNTLTETEQYFEYKIDMRPQALTSVGKNYITDIRNVGVTYANGSRGTEQWYHFSIPISSYNRKVGGITDFKSIRFMRMYATGWQDSVNFRFAKLSLLRNQWRNFAYEITNDGTYTVIPTNTTTSLTTLAVNIENNNTRMPVPYIIPPGIERVQSLATGGVTILSNEQSMSLQVRNLQTGHGRGVFKALGLDLRKYKKLSMFIHAEELATNDPFHTRLSDSMVNGVVRLGQDYQSNFYEISIPLKITRLTASFVDTTVWPTVNNLDLNLQDLITLKNLRNTSNVPVGSYFSQVINGRKLAIYGNPNLGDVEGVMFNIFNVTPDNSIGAEVWVDELRLSGLDEKAAYAATGRVDIKLADLGSMSFSASYHSVGWGSIEQKVNERAKESITQYDFSTSLQLGKLLPKQTRLSVPFYASISSIVSTPEYDAYDLDVNLKDKLAATKDAHARDSISSASLTKSNTSTVSFSNVKVMPKPGVKIKPWSISNFDFTYAYYRQRNSSPTVTEDLTQRYHAVINYNFAGRSVYVSPFKVLFKKTKTHWFDLIKDFNFNLVPSLISVRMDINRQFGRFVPRIVNSFDNKVDVPDTTYNKFFTFDRFYAFRWDLTRSMNIDFTATNRARVDEPSGELTKATKDTISRNFWKGGRNTSYKQDLILSYTLPFSKLPLTDWITSRVSYTGHYVWAASSLLAQSLNQGNVLENGATKNLHGEFDFARLYGKSRWLRELDQQKMAAPKNPNPLDFAKERALLKKKVALLDSTEKAFKAKLAKMNRVDRKLARRQERERLANERQAQQVEIGTAPRIFGKLLTMVKRATVDYGEVFTSRIPGYLDSTQLFGNNFKSNQPGLGYILGKAPDDNFLDKMAQNGLLTRDSTFSLLFTQSYDQKLNVQVSLEPFREFNIDITLDKSFNKQFQELFKDTTGHSGFSHLSPYLTGGYSVSFISFQTLFQKYDPNALNVTFQRFQDYRQKLSVRVANNNPYWKNNGSQFNANGYAGGYGQYSQDVLIPAFIAAYTNKSPNDAPLIDETNSGKISSNPFHNIKPMPNWHFNFTGLNKVPALQKIFTAISITHGYVSHLSMNSFQSALDYMDPFHLGGPSFIDTVSHNYIPYFVVPNLTITEAFEPLIRIDFTTIGKLSGSLGYSKSRQLSLSLIDYQLSEMRSKEFTFSASYRKKGFPLPFKLPKILSVKGSNKLDNDVTFKMDFSLRDDVTANSTLDQGATIPTSGQKVVKISPSIDYILNKRINVRLYFDQQRVIPYVSSSAETVNTKAGVALRISLAQ